MRFSPKQIVEELEREHEMRLSVYPRMVREGRMTRDTMEHRMAVLEQVLAEYRGKARAPKQEDLFGGGA